MTAKTSQKSNGSQSPKKSDAGSPPASPKSGAAANGGGKKTQPEKPDNVIRVSRTHTASFYIRAATQFLQGVVGKDGKEKKIFDDIVISALGAAIPTAAQVSGILERNEVGSIKKVETSYTDLEFGRRPQILITMKRNPKYVAPPPRERDSNTQRESKTSNASGKASNASRSSSPKANLKAAPGKAKFKAGPEQPERLKTDKLTKKMAKVLKEGGKRGVEIEGQADMGGLKYFCNKVLEPAGDLDMLVESVKAMNAESNPADEERKGGSGHVGKTVWSMADQNDLCVVCYVPPHVTDFAADQWLKLILEKLGVAKAVKIRDDSNLVYAQVHIKNDEPNDVFCLKLRDYVIQFANQILTEKKLIPEIESDDEEMIFGDEDFDM